VSMVNGKSIDPRRGICIDGVEAQRTKDPLLHELNFHVFSYSR